MTQLELFRKKEGMTQAASADRYHLERARKIASRLGLTGIPVDIDMVREEAERLGDPLPASNYLGSVFRGWILSGYKIATHKGSHGRLIRTWTVPNNIRLSQVLGK